MSTPACHKHPSLQRHTLAECATEPIFTKPKISNGYFGGFYFELIQRSVLGLAVLCIPVRQRKPFQCLSPFPNLPSCFLSTPGHAIVCSCLACSWCQSFCRGTSQYFVPQNISNHELYSFLVLKFLMRNCIMETESPWQSVFLLQWHCYS